MKNSLKNLAPCAYGITRRAGLLTLLGSALTLAGCGGGGGDIAGLSTGGTGSFSVGPITGFGSIFVNGVRFDDSTASVSDDNGGLRNRSDLKLGMMVSVTGSSVTRSTVAGDSATASTIVFGGELQGPISAITASPQTLTVLGQTVTITGSTIFDVSINGGFTSLAVNDIVEVHGVVNQVNNTIQATFIEKKTSTDVFKIQGLPSNHNSSTKTFKIGEILINYSATPADEVRITPNDGALVRVRLSAVLPAPAEWTATRIRPPENHANVSRDEAEIEGSVTAINSASQFSVNGILVNTTSNTAFPDSTALAPGMRVEVKGSLSNGVLTATRVQTEIEINNLEFQFNGTIQNLDTTAQTFALRNATGVTIVTVAYSLTSTDFRDGNVSNLADVNRRVEVRGLPSSDGSRVVATRIKFE